MGFLVGIQSVSSLGEETNSSEERSHQKLLDKLGFCGVVGFPPSKGLHFNKAIKTLQILITRERLPRRGKAPGSD